MKNTRAKRIINIREVTSNLQSVKLAFEDDDLKMSITALDSAIYVLNLEVKLQALKDRRSSKTTSVFEKINQLGLKNIS